MNDVASLIRRMTKDLRALQNAMREAKNEPLPNGSHEGLLNEIIDTELVAEFKGAIDEVRYFLWCYDDIFAAQYQSNSSHYRENSHLRLVSEMLQILSRLLQRRRRRAQSFLNESILSYPTACLSKSRDGTQ